MSVTSMSVTSRLLSAIPIIGTKFQRLIGDVGAIRAELDELRGQSDRLVGEVGSLKDGVAAIGGTQTKIQAEIQAAIQTAIQTAIQADAENRAAIQADAENRAAAQAAVQAAMQADVERLFIRVEVLTQQLGEGMEQMAAGYDANTVRVAQQEAEVATLRAALQRSDAPMTEAAALPASTGEGDAADGGSAVFEDLFRQWTAVAGPDTPAGLHALYAQVARQYSDVLSERDALQQRAALLSDTLQHVRRNVGDRVVEVAAASAHFNVLFPEAITEIAGVLPVTVVDVGAQMLSSEDHVYALLLAAGHCRVIGFEPLKEAADKRTGAEPGVLMLNHFIGKGGPASFQVASFDPASSLLEPNLSYLEQFFALVDMCRPAERQMVETTRLDDIAEVSACDYLKIDVQGGELDVLRGAERLLDHVLYVHSEVEFEPVYQDQPLFPDIDRHLRERGFELLDLTKLGHSGYAALPWQQTRTKLLWADAIYVKTVDRLVEQGAVALLKAAYIAHVNYGMYDYAAHLIAHYDRTTGSALLPVYHAAVNG